MTRRRDASINQWYYISIGHSKKEAPPPMPTQKQKNEAL
jgi:hypothetical protein